MDPASIPAESDARAPAGPPPGYAVEAKGARESDEIVGPPFWFSLLFLTTTIAATHELFATQAAAYLDPGYGLPRWQASGCGALGLLVGAIAAWRLAKPGREALPWLLSAASLIMTGSAWAWLLSFASPRLFAPTAIAVPLLGGLALGAAAATAVRVLGRTLLALGVIDRALAPLRLGAIALGLGLAAAAASSVGLLRSAAAIGLMLAVLAAWSGPLLVFLERVPLKKARAARAAAGTALVVGFVALIGAEALVPASDLAQHANPIVYSDRSERATYVVTSGQDAFELFVDGRLSMSGIDERRYHEALVHPAMLSAPRRARVLVLGGGHGAVLREVLRHPDVERVTHVVVDRALTDLALRMVWLTRLAGPGSASAELELIEAEPVVWLSERRGPFDVAIVDLPDPTTYVDGKNYTRHFYELLLGALGPDGVAVVQATSLFSSPRTFAGIEHTLRAAGLSTLGYRAAVPTFGDWGFVLAARRPLAPPPRDRLDPFLSGSTSVELFSVPRDTRTPSPPAVSTLHDPVVVETFAEERTRLGL